MSCALLLALAAAPALQEPATEQPVVADAVVAATPLEEIRAAFTGGFLGLERKDGREGQGHILATELPGGFVGRDYWSVGGGRRLYAGHDVLQFTEDGVVRHWWFGSRGDQAYAEGTWTERGALLYVLDDDGDRLRRYTYSLQVAPPLAFHFQNDHADGEDWEPFMDTDWRRAAVAPPPDFQPDVEDAADSWRRHYVGEWDSLAGRHRGRWLFDEWLLLDTPDEHAVLAAGWFGKLRMRVWRKDGTTAELAGKRKDEVLRLRVAAEEDGPWVRVDTLVPGGYRSQRGGRELDFRRLRDG